MQDRPDQRELLDAIRGFLETEMLPQVGEHRLRFRTLVAINLLKMAGRESELEAGLRQSEWRRLDRLLGVQPDPATEAELPTALRERQRELARLIAAGAAPDGTRELLEQTVRDKLRVSNPTYLDGFAPV